MKPIQIARIALLSAILLVSQIALAVLPNCELVSLLIIVFTLLYGKEMFIVTFVFALCETVVYGVGMWVLMYFYVWPLLVLLVLLFKNIFKQNFVLWAILAGTFGLFFGLLCSISYLPLGWSYALSYYVAGIPWDVTHAICNFILVLLLGGTLYSRLSNIKHH